MAAAVAGDASAREDAGRRLQEMGEVAVPALIEAKGRANPLETRKWAIAVLEAMNKKVPGEAVQTKDGALLAEVLQAYGKTRDLDALGAVFAFANSDRTPVREASREAIGQYGDAALPKLRETYTNLKNAPAPETWGAAELGRELFRLMDHVRLRDLYAMFDEALLKAKADAGAGPQGRPESLEPSVTLLDQVFARAPLFDRRDEAVPVYVRYAQAIEPSDPARALDYYRKAERLAPGGTERDRISSAITWLEAHRLAAGGVVDRAALRHAIELDPENAHAKTEMARLDEESRSRTRHVTWMLSGAAVLILFATAALLFIRRNEKPQA